ncbi:MAG TPA: DUF2785 domain-containing protein [Anaerolineales bacterium]|nr:DUF2785 domain-containing protein [Anaerolineales bacterium]
MDKEFWVSISNNEYVVPEGYSLENLTELLFSYLGSTDPELRDEIAYIVYANWLKRDLYSGEAIQSHIDFLLSNLEKGIGETDSDTVFLRAFSILLLAEIVHTDNKKSLLEEDQVKRILEKGLWYLQAERDPRGYVPGKGWAHALAHTADLLLVLAHNRNTEGADLLNMLNAVSDKMVHSTKHVYIHGEDDRLASAVIEILRRDLIPLEKVEVWICSLTSPNGMTWKGAYIDEEKNRAFQNTRNLLRSIHLHLLLDDEPLPRREQLFSIFLDALRNLKPY